MNAHSHQHKISTKVISSIALNGVPILSEGGTFIFYFSSIEQYLTRRKFSPLDGVLLQTVKQKK